MGYPSRVSDISVLSEPHVGVTDKPNEDGFYYNEELGLGVVADGVTQHRNRQGQYPENTTLAPRILVEELESFFNALVTTNLTAEHWPKTIRDALELANVKIAEANSLDRKLNPSTREWYFRDTHSTTTCVLWLTPWLDVATYAYIGDCMMFYIPRVGEPRLLTENQLVTCNQFRKSVQNHWERKRFTRQEAKDLVRWFNYKIFRNNPTLYDREGKRLGYGVLNGDPEAPNMLSISTLKVQPGDRFLLSTDALRACSGAPDDEPDLIELYTSLIQELSNVPTGQVPGFVIEKIRRMEEVRALRSDDATVMLVQVR